MITQADPVRLRSLREVRQGKLVRALNKHGRGHHISRPLAIHEYSYGQLELIEARSDRKGSYIVGIILPNPKNDGALNVESGKLIYAGGRTRQQTYFPGSKEYEARQRTLSRTGIKLGEAA